MSGQTLTLAASEQDFSTQEAPQAQPQVRGRREPKPTRKPGGVQHEQRQRRVAHIPLFCSEEFADVLVMRQWHLDLSTENVELVRQWLSHRRMLLALRLGDKPELPGGFFRHIDLSGCYVAAAGNKSYWDQPATIDRQTQDYWSQPAKVALLRNLELTMRQEITRQELPVVETVPAFVAVVAPVGRKVCAAVAKVGVAARRMRVIGCSTTELAAKPDTEMVMVYDHTRRSSVSVDCHPSKLANLEVRRIAWRDGKPTMSMFSAFIWRGDDEVAMFNAAHRRVAAWAVPRADYVRTVKPPYVHIGGMPQWLGEFLADKARFQSPAGFAAHLYRSALPGRWKRTTANLPAGRDRVLRMVDAFRAPGVPRPV